MKYFLYKLTYKLVAATIRIVLFINGGLEVKGKENIPREGGLLVAANHISYLDPPVLGAVIPRVTTFMARKGLFEMPVIRWMIKGSAIPVNRERPGPSTIKEIIRRLRGGEVVAMFPEGRRSDTGRLLEAKRGVGMIISRSGVPVIPALITGTDRALPPHAKWLKRAGVRVVFGKPISFATTEDLRNHEVHEEISNSIMSAIKELGKIHGDNSS